MSIKYFRLTCAFIALMYLSACNKQTITDQVVSIPAEGWYFTDKVNFEYVISDTMASYDILVHVRNLKNYSYSNLWLFIETISPSGNRQRDTLEIILADKNGRWMGKSTQSVNTMLVPYKEDVRFSERGIYETSLQHAMRDTVIQHITDIGLRIQYHVPK